MPSLEQSEVLVPWHYPTEKDRVKEELASLGIVARVGLVNHLGDLSIRVSHEDDAQVAEVIAPNANVRITGDTSLLTSTLPPTHQ